MHARPGDRLVVESPVTGTSRRDGEIVALHHADGTPPYDVRWSDTGEITLVFPGPDAHIRHEEDDRAETRTPLRRGDWGNLGHLGDQGERAAEESPAVPTTPRTARPGDIGRRLTAARLRRGLSLEETAEQARMSPQYLAYLEARPSDPNPATLLRLADVLGTTLDGLRGGDQDQPPGQGYALRRPELQDLTPDECRALLAGHGVGRVALSTAQGPAVFPVNYDVVDDALVFRTASDAAPAAAVGAEVAFEVDYIDEAMSQGWSVLAVGRAEAVTEPGELRRLEGQAHSDPWAGGRRTLWVRIRPARLTGRRITPADR